MSYVTSGSAALLPIVKKKYGSSWLRGGEVSALDLAVAFEHLYRDTIYYRALLESGHKLTDRDAFQKHTVINMWDQLFQKLSQ
jgi:hypothetical protein